MKLRTRFTLAALAAALAAPLASAHEVWLLPSSTVLSNTGYVTVDAAVSNDIFHFNYRPLGIRDNLRITAPDGSSVEAETLTQGKLRTVFDANLGQTGSYRMAVTNAGVMAMWKEGSERKRWRGPREELEANVPVDSAELTLRESVNRVETFVTVGSPTALAPTGLGLELVPVTHPNDLYAGETASFRFVIDGQPSAGVKVTLIAAGTRYRDALDKVELESDAEGLVALRWPVAGFYYLSAVVSDANSSLRNADRRLSYTATLEVLPQ